MARGRKASETPSTDLQAGRRRKRQASLTPSVASQAPDASSQASQRSQSPASDGEQKPRKRVKRAWVTDEEQLEQELQEAVEHSNDRSSPDPIDATVSLDASSSQQRRVRFSDPGPPIVSAQVTPPAVRTAASTQPPAGLTPHIERAGLQPTKSGRKARFSLPASLPGRTQNGGIEELHFTPLRTALDNRQRRRLRRSGLSQEMNDIDEHRKEDARARRELERLRKQITEKDQMCKDLEYQLEVQRQWSIDVHNDTEDADKTKAMEEELSRLRTEIAEHREREDSQQIGLSTIDEDQDEDMEVGGDFYEDDVDDDNILLIEPADISVTEEEMGLREIDEEAEAVRASGATEDFTESTTQISLPDPHEESQIYQFEQAISQISREAADVKAALSILTVELQTLGFTTPDASADVVLGALRNAFRDARENLEAILPGDPATTFQNGPFLHALVEHLRRLKVDFDAETERVREQTELNKALNVQNKGLVAKMAKHENRRQTLESQWHQLDTDNEKRAKTITELEQENDQLLKAIDERDSELNASEQYITDLDAQLADHEETNESLQNELNGFREEVSKLQSLIEKVEEEHKTAFENLKAEHAAVVNDLKEKLATQTSHREIAEGEIDEKVSFITALELKIEAAETDLDNLRNDLEQLRDQKNSEQSQREAAEEELDRKTEDIARLEGSVGSAEEALEDLRSQLATLRTRLDNERAQREAAEEDLDSKNEFITELETKIHHAGIEANELRQKLFELGLQRDAKIQELEEAAAARAEQYEAELDQEVVGRKAAEALAEENGELLKDEKEISKSLDNAFHAAKKQYEELAEQKLAEIEGLQKELGEVKQEYQDAQAENEARIEQTTQEMDDLNRQLGEAEQYIQELQNTVSAQDAQILDHTNFIGELEEHLEVAHGKIEILENTERVLGESLEEERTAADTTKAQLSDENTDLKSQIVDMEEQIQQLQDSVDVRDRKYTLDINSKNSEIDNWQLIAETRAKTISTLATDLDALKKRFVSQTQASKDTIHSLVNNIHRTAEAADALQSQHDNEAQREIEAVQAMKMEGVHVTQVHDRVNVLKGKGGQGNSRGGIRDSGIGVAEDEEEYVDQTEIAIVQEQ